MCHNENTNTRDILMDSKKQFNDRLERKSSYLQVTLDVVNSKTLHAHDPQDTFRSSPCHMIQRM
jgi:hypothetical protein